MDNLKKVLNEVIDLFPNEIKSGIIHQIYSVHLLNLKTAVSYLYGNNKASILDIGAGSGVVSLALRKLGHGVHAIDTWEEYGQDFVNEDGIKEDIVNRLETNEVKTTFCNIEKTPIPFDDGSFDMVLFLDVLEHLHNSPKKVLEEIKRILKPGGILIITTPNLATLKNRLYMLIGRSIYTDLEYWYNSEPFFGHVREYTAGEIKKMLTWHQFKVESVKFSNARQVYILKDFKLNLYTIAMTLYLLITTIIPGLRYQTIVVGKR